MTTCYLTFADLALLVCQQFDVDAHGRRPINVAHPEGNEFVDYDFERLEPHIPGRDRLVRLTFYSRPDEESETRTWHWACFDRNDDGDIYGQAYGSADTLAEALADIRAVPWRPSAERLLELLREATGEVVCRDGLLTFPEGAQASLRASKEEPSSC